MFFADPPRMRQAADIGVADQRWGVVQAVVRYAARGTNKSKRT